MPKPLPDFSTIGGRLRWSREFVGETLQQAGDAVGINKNTLQAWEVGSRSKRGVPAADIEALARHYRVSAAWLALGEGPPMHTETRLRRVPVTGDLQAGLWRESNVWPDARHYEVAIPDAMRLIGQTLYAAEVRGTSMNRAYPEGTIVVLQRVVGGREDLIAGKRYHIDRERSDGRFESTLKTVRYRADGSLWLQPESDDPEFQEAIRLDGDHGIHFIGRVVFALTSE